MSMNDRVKAINEARIRAIEDQKALLDSIKPGDTRTAEQVEQLEKQDAAIKDYDAQVRDIVARETREIEAAALREGDERVFGTIGADKRETHEQDTLRAWLNMNPADRGDLEVNVQAAAKERQMLRAGASPEEIRNAVTWDTGSIASAVPVTMSRTLYEYMEASIAAFRIGATQINTASGENIDFPKLNAHAIATQVAGQGTALAGTDPTFAKLTLGAKKYGQLVVVANEVLSDTVFDVSTFLGRDIGRALGRLIDTDLVTGTGGVTGGIMSSGLGSVVTGATTYTALTDMADPYGKLVDVAYSVVDEYRSNAAWLMRDATAGLLRKLRDGAGGTLGAVMWEPSLTNGLINGQPDRFLGYAVYTDANVASMASNTRPLAFGDYSSYYLRTVGNVQIDSSTERYFDTDQTGFRGKWRVDGGYIDTTAVKVLVNKA